jgi:diphosphomevalonate decarboxylase
VKKIDVVRKILADRFQQSPVYQTAEAFAPTNIALCKYWGKRDTELNLPLTSSLSVSLAHKGALTRLTVNDLACDVISLNNQKIKLSDIFSQKLIEFLNLFRAETAPKFNINIDSNIPIAAGLASSACGFAVLVRVLDKLYDWQLSLTQQSILARLGSGSACRSLWDGFVEWEMGVASDGMDSHGQALPAKWPELSVGLHVIAATPKKLSSRLAMQQTVLTSQLYQAWPQQVKMDLANLKTAISEKDFLTLGKTAENNALAMHATMLSAWPPIQYSLPETHASMDKVWQLRREGLNVFFTQDAGPNLKLLFLAQDLKAVTEQFSNIEVVMPFDSK